MMQWTGEGTNKAADCSGCFRGSAFDIFANRFESGKKIFNKKLDFWRITRGIRKFIRKTFIENIKSFLPGRNLFQKVHLLSEF